MQDNRDDYELLNLMGITTWEVREKSNSDLLWRNLEERVRNCIRCELAKSRIQTVFGSGNRSAKVILVGEAPGRAEDQQGQPFVGRAGMLLTSMLTAIGLNRKDIFIANILKCRPPNNRDPQPNEIELCQEFLHHQIKLINPQLIVALGRVAANHLLKTKSSLNMLRAKLHKFTESVPLIVSYHPAYLLRAPQEKGKAYRDLLFIKECLSKTH